METRKKRRRTDGREKDYRRNRRLGALFTIALALLILALFFGVWLTPVRISGDSMAPALREGEIVLVDRLAKYWKTPARGDMVMFRTADGDFIKRIAGLPGETVDIQEGKAYIDGRPLDETAYAANYVGSMEPVTVPEGSVFLLGDNRALIYDSRLANLGCVAYTEIFGALRVRVSPLSRVTVFF